MVKIWRNRIWAGTQVLANCPARYKTGVMDMMAEDLEDNQEVGDKITLYEY